MRFAALLALVLGACGASKTTGPAWPEMAERENDGGESIAPRTPQAVASAAVEEEAAEETPAAAATATPAAETATPAATTATPTVTLPEDAITIDEIVIEITDDE